MWCQCFHNIALIIFTEQFIMLHQTGCLAETANFIYCMLNCTHAISTSHIEFNFGFSGMRRDGCRSVTVAVPSLSQFHCIPDQPHLLLICNQCRYLRCRLRDSYFRPSPVCFRYRGFLRAATPALAAVNRIEGYNPSVDGCLSHRDGCKSRTYCLNGGS